MQAGISAAGRNLRLPCSVDTQRACTARKRPPMSVSIPLTSGYCGRPVGNASVIMTNNATGSTSQQASDLAKRLKVELRGLEPLASCMPFMTNPSGMVRDGQVRADQGRFTVWHRPEATGAVRARSHLVCHWFSGPSPEDGASRTSPRINWTRH
jgi:hypothetical protein